MGSLVDYLAHLNGRIQVILFDLDGTLRYHFPPADQALYDYAVSLGLEDGLEKRRRAARWAHYYWAESPEYQEDMARFPERGEEFWRNYTVRSLLAFDCDHASAVALADQVRSWMQTEYQPEDRLSPHVLEMLQMLKEHGFRLGVLSNRKENCLEYLGQLGLASFFELSLVAGEVQKRKPDPDLFLIALERIGIDPSQAIYVGDNYYADIIGARGAGIFSILYDPMDIFQDADCVKIKAISELRLLVGEKRDADCSMPMHQLPGVP